MADNEVKSIEVKSQEYAEFAEFIILHFKLLLTGAAKLVAM